MSEFHALIQSLIHNVQTPDLKIYRDRAQQIRDKNTPRKLFERWRDSNEGKEWKNRKFEQIQGCCPGCNLVFPSIHYLVIDHIQSISQYPELATDISNFQLLCDPCNRRKSST